MTTTSEIPFHPLTTVFTEPANCKDKPYNVGVTAGTTIIDKYRYDVSESSCYQYGYYDWYSSYSPGMCPSGYTTDYTSLIDRTITSARCCPSGLYAGNGAGQWFAGCYSSYTTSKTVSVFDQSQSKLVTVVAGPGIVIGQAYIVFYQSKDLSLFPPGYTPGTVASSTTNSGLIAASTSSRAASAGSATAATSSKFDSTSATSSNTGSAAAATSSSTSTDSGSLSAGVKASIGLAIGLVAVLTSIVLFWLLRRRRQRKTAIRGQDGQWTTKPELEAASNEKQGPLIAEVSGASKLPAEMSTTVACYELPGSKPTSPQLDSNPIYEFPAERSKI